MRRYEGYFVLMIIDDKEESDCYIKFDMFLFGGKKNQPKKIDGELEDRVKTTTKGKLCPICGKASSSKVAFGQEVQPSLTCNNCELKAVGNTIQRLGPKNLITSQKFAGLLTTELITYQKGQVETPLAQKQNSNLVHTLDKQVSQISTSIKSEFRTLKQLSKTKIEELTSEADKQNVMPIFDDTLKLYSQKKNIGSDFIHEALKRAHIGSKGLYFVDQQELDTRNSVIDQRFSTLKKQTKMRLKDLNSLIADINSIKLE